jgi:hypothetical protein
MRRLAPGLCLLWLACSQQHDPEVMPVRANDCETCHTPEYLAAVEPPHENIFPRECALCHTNTEWAPAIFSHDAVKSRECVLCHQSDYDGTADPVHSGMYPTTCDDCHGTTAWRPALEGIHPEASFPIENGAHENIGCTDCHNPDLGSSVGGANTDCIGCHTGEHSEARVNDQHDEVRDYFFDASMPNFCLQCHPNGRH